MLSDDFKLARKIINDLEKMLHEEHHGSGGHFDCDVCSAIAECTGIRHMWDEKYGNA